MRHGEGPRNTWLDKRHTWLDKRNAWLDKDIPVHVKKTEQDIIKKK